MVILEVGIATYLEGYAPLFELIGNRVFPMKIPQGAEIPCLTYQRISTPRILTHDTSGATGDLVSPRVQFDAWATTQLAAKIITDVLRGGLNGKTGVIGGVTIRAALAENEAPGWDEAAELYRSRSDYIIWQEEA